MTYTHTYTHAYIHTGIHTYRPGRQTDRQTALLCHSACKCITTQYTRKSQTYIHACIHTRTQQLPSRQTFYNQGVDHEEGQTVYNQGVDHGHEEGQTVYNPGMNHGHEVGGPVLAYDQVPV